MLLAALVCVLFVASLKDYSVPVLAFRQVSAPPVPASVRERDGKLLVRVTNESGAPVQGARLVVLLVRERVAYLAGAGETDERGIKTIDSLPRGNLWVLADAPGRQRASTQLVLGRGAREVAMVLRNAGHLSVQVQTVQDEPVPHARVQVRCSDPLPFLATTDDQGRVTVDRLCAPPYEVRASADGYEGATRTGVMPGPEPLVMRLQPLGTLRVRVVLEDGQPAPLSQVFLSGPGIWPARQTKTNAFGETTIAGLPEGTYDLRASRGELVSNIRTGVFVTQGKPTDVTLTMRKGRQITVRVTQGDADDAPGVANAAVVIAEEGLSSFPLEGKTDPQGHVTLGPFSAVPLTASARAEEYVSSGAVAVPIEATEVRIAMLKAGRLAGDVVDSRGFPVLGATIEVIGTDTRGFPIAENPAMQAFRHAHFAWALQGPPSLIPVGELGVMPGPIPPIPRGAPVGGAQDADSIAPSPWVTDRQGEFNVGPITPGRVSAIVRHPAYVEAISEAVSVPPGGSARVRVVLYAGGTLEGKVLDDRRFPIAGARVQITATKAISERSTLTADDGSFAFSAVHEDFVLTAFRPDALEDVAYKETLHVDADERKTIEIILQSEREPVSVQVEDDRGYPVDAAQVTATSMDSENPLRRTGFTSADGHVSLANARGLPLRVVVKAPGYAAAVRTYDAAPEELKVTLHNGVRVTGTVTGRDGRDRVRDARITAYLDTGPVHLTTNQQGEYAFDDAVPGTIRLRVEHDDYVAVEKSVVVKESAAGRPVELEAIDLEEAGEVEGEVVDDRGDRIAGARIAKDQVPQFLPVGKLPPGVVESNERGEFVLKGLPEGKVLLEAYAPGVGRGLERDVDVRRGRTTTRVRIVIDRSSEAAGPAVVAGVLLSLREDVNGVQVSRVFAGSEAEQAGIRPGDLILSIDGRLPASVREAERLLLGPERQDVILELGRGEQTRRLRVPRERIRQ